MINEAELEEFLSDEALFDPLRDNRHVPNLADGTYEFAAMLVGFQAESHPGFHVTPALSVKTTTTQGAMPLTPAQAFQIGSELVRMALATNEDEVHANRFHRELMALERLADLRVIGAEIKGRKR
jgi:hypothetical protein